MKKVIILLFLVAATSVYALQASAAKSAKQTDLLAIAQQISESSGQKIVFNPDYNASVVVFGDTKNIDDFRYILAGFDLSVLPRGDFLVVTPVKNLRASAIPVVEEGKNYHPEEFVSEVILMEKLCATQILPILRPSIPPGSHLAADVYSNKLLISDSFANIEKIRDIVHRFEAGVEKKQSCKFTNKKTH